MKKFLLITAVFLIFASCGVKSDPEYRSQNKHNAAIHIA